MNITCAVYNLDRLPVISNVFRLLCSLEAGLTVKDMCFRSDLNSLNVDERFVLFQLFQLTICTVFINYVCILDNQRGEPEQERIASNK